MRAIGSFNVVIINWVRVYLSFHPQSMHTKDHSRSVGPQKNRHNYLITRSILKFPTLRRSGS